MINLHDIKCVKQWYLLLVSWRGHLNSLSNVSLDLRLSVSKKK